MRFAGWLALALGGLVIQVQAQSPEERRQIDGLRDTLRLVTDTMVLREREDQLLLAALRSRDQPFYHLYLGTLAHRQGELGGVAHLDESAAEFRWTTRLAPDWTYAWSGAGLAEFALGDRLAIGSARDPRRLELAVEAYRRGALALARAVSLDPALAPGLVILARRAIREGFRDQAVAVREALQRAAPDGRGAVLLALGRVQRQLGDSGALRSFTKYVASGQHRPLGLVELGRTQLLLGDLSGMVRYLSAAGESDTLALRELRADLAPIATEEELQEFDRRTGARRLEFLRRFWTVRDRLALRTDGERLAEHIRRLALASRDFLVFDPDGTAHLDDRGRIYVRHGEPDQRVAFSVPGIEPNESWCYRGAPGDSSLVLHFAAHPSLHDFHLVESIQDLVDGRRPPSSRAAPDPALFRSRSSIDELYREIPSEKRALPAYLLRERALGRYGMRVATRYDSYRLGLGRSGQGWSGVLVAGSTAASPVLQLAYSLPAPLEDSGGGSHPLEARLRFVALDTMGTVIASIDTVVRQNPSSGRRLAGALALPVRPGLLLVHQAIQTNADQGIDSGIDTIAVPAPGGGALALGDLLVGSGIQGLPVVMSDGAEFLLSTGGSIDRSGSVRLAIEVYGLGTDAKAAVRVLVAPGVHPESWRTWPGRLTPSTLVRNPGTGPVVTWRASLPAHVLRAGEWRVAVEVTSDRVVVRREAILALRVR